MTPIKYLWTALSGSVSIILLLVTAWAADVAHRTSNLELQLNLQSQQFIELKRDIMDLKTHVDDLRDEVKKGDNRRSH